MPARRPAAGRAARFEIEEPSRLDKDFGPRHAHGAHLLRRAPACYSSRDLGSDKAAAVDGEMVDVISNMPLVRAFCGLSFEHDRFDATVNRELTARGRSLRYLEKLRIAQAAITLR